MEKENKPEIKIILYSDKTLEEGLRYCNPHLSEEKLKELVEACKRFL